MEDVGAPLSTDGGVSPGHEDVLGKGAIADLASQGHLVTNQVEDIAGEPFEEIMERCVPKPLPRSFNVGGRPYRETGEWSGSWDNAVKSNEGE